MNFFNMLYLIKLFLQYYKIKYYYYKVVYSILKPNIVLLKLKYIKYITNLKLFCKIYNFLVINQHYFIMYQN